MSWQKQVQLLWWSQLIAITAMEMSEPFWPLFLRQLDPGMSNIERWSAVIYAAPLLISGLIAPYWGKLGDRFGHKRMLLRASLGLAITQGLLYFSTSLWEVLAYRLLQGALAGIITAVFCFANAVAPESKRSSVVGRLTSATAAGAIMGPLLGGVLIEWLNFQALFICASLVCFLITLALALWLKNDTPCNSLQISKPAEEQPVMQGQVILLFLLVIFLLQIAKAIPSSYFALYAEQYLSITPWLTGLLFSAAGVGMMVSAPYWGKVFDQVSINQRPLILSLIALVAGGCYLLHLQNSWLTLLLVRFSWGVCLGAMLPMVQASIINLSDKQKHGLVIGQAQRTIKIGNLAGVALGAYLLTWWDYQSGFGIAGLVYFLAASILLLIGLRLAKSSDLLVIKQ